MEYNKSDIRQMTDQSAVLTPQETKRNLFERLHFIKGAYHV